MPWLQLSGARRHNSAVLLKDEMISSIKPWCHNWRLENNEDFCRLCQCESNNLKMYERSHRTPSAFIHLLNDGFKKRREAMLGRPARDVDLPWHSWTAARSPACGTPPCSGCRRRRPSWRMSWTRRPGCRWRLPWRLWRHKKRRKRDEVKSWTAAAGGERMWSPHLSCDAVPCVPALWEDHVYIRMLHPWPGGKKYWDQRKTLNLPSSFSSSSPPCGHRRLTLSLTDFHLHRRGRTHHQTHPHTDTQKKNIYIPCMLVSSKGQNSTDGSTNPFPCVCKEGDSATACCKRHCQTTSNQMSRSPACLSTNWLIWKTWLECFGYGICLAVHMFEGICSTEWIFTCAAGSKWQTCFTLRATLTAIRWLDEISKNADASLAGSGASSVAYILERWHIGAAAGRLAGSPCSSRARDSEIVHIFTLYHGRN